MTLDRMPRRWVFQIGPRPISSTDAFATWLDAIVFDADTSRLRISPAMRSSESSRFTVSFLCPSIRRVPLG